MTSEPRRPVPVALTRPLGLPRAARRLAALAGLPLLAACADGAEEPAASAAPDPAEAAQQAPAAGPYATEDVPQIWMALEPGQSGAPASVLFAIDSGFDGSVADDQAVRITPEPTGARSGNCSIQNLTSYEFVSNGPVFSAAQANQGVKPEDIPRFLAFTASQAMVSAGMAGAADETAAQNICTRKFWELWLEQAEPIQPSGDAQG
ncbi:MAG: hypothetical protein AAF677_17290 [Pseudomonadota bacterium]